MDLVYVLCMSIPTMAIYTVFSIRFSFFSISSLFSYICIYIKDKLSIHSRTFNSLHRIEIDKSTDRPTSQPNDLFRPYFYRATIALHYT